MLFENYLFSINMFDQHVQQMSAGNQSMKK